MSDQTPSMFRWMFSADSPLDRLVRRGAAGVAVAAIVAAGMKVFRPNSTVTCVVCFLIAVALGIPAALSTFPPRDPTLRVPVGVLAAAFAWMGILFFFDATGIYKGGIGFETWTDAIGTLFFAAAWFLLTVQATGSSEQNADRVSIVVVCLLLIIAAATKVLVTPIVTEITPLTNEAKANIDAARALLNVCNAAVLLGLYAQMRRLFPPPDPVTHTAILLYGCAQIASPESDCLRHGCVTSLQTTVAFGVAWTLLVGKVAMGLYIAFVYFNSTVSQLSKEQRSSDSGNEGVVRHSFD